MFLATCWLVLALALLLAAAQTSPWLLVALPVVAFAARRSVSHHATLKGHDAVHALRVDRDSLIVETGDNPGREVRVSGNSRLFGNLLLLKLYPVDSTKKAYTVILIATPLARNVDAEAFRRLRVWLRFAGARHQDTTTFPL